MHELIWFSVPGAVVSVMLIAIRPSLIGSDARTAAWVVIVPMLGFCLHQSFRVIFEWRGGFRGRQRTALEAIVRLGEAQEPPVQLSWDQAFLVWEITFYGDKFPAAFRDHDRGAWHYILSFWSVSFAGVLAAVLGVSVLLSSFKAGTVLCLVALEVGTAVVFFVKGSQTRRSLLEQESAAVRRYSDEFICTMRLLQRQHSA